MFATGNVWTYWPVFIRGLGMTLLLSAIALAAGLLLGFCLGLTRCYGPRLLRLGCAAFTEAFRSIPPLLLFFGAYYGLSYATGVSLSPFQAAIVAMTMETGALMSEAVRSAFRSVGPGQGDAASALGLGFWATQITVVAPQAIRVLVPPAVGVYVAVIKDSSFASVVGLMELSGSGTLVRQTVGDSLLTFSLVAGLYLLLNFSISTVGAALERQFAFVT